MVTLLETAMLVCFAISWPAAIHRSWVSRTSKGKSFLFLLFLLLGYSLGITKVIVNEGILAFLLIPYTFNFFLISIDMLLYFRNARLDKARDAVLFNQ